MSIFQQAAALVSDPPGNLVYYLVLLFAMGVAAAVALAQWRATPSGTPHDAAPSRLALAACLLFVLRVLALAFAILAAIGVLDSLIAIPPVERAVSTLTIIVVFWFVLFPQTNRLADATFGLLSLLVILGLAISWGLWYQQAPLLHYYNGSPQETVWERAQLFLLVTGIILLVIRRRADWLLAMAIALLLLAAHVVHYLYPIAQSNVSGTERLFEIVVLPLIAAVVLRRTLLSAAVPAQTVIQTVPPAEGSTHPTEAAVQPIAPPQPNLDPRAAVALAFLGTAADLTNLAQSAAVAVAEALPASTSLLLTPAGDGFKIECVYQAQSARFITTLLPVLSDSSVICAGLEQADTILGHWENLRLSCATLPLRPVCRLMRRRCSCRCASPAGRYWVPLACCRLPGRQFGPIHSERS